MCMCNHTKPYILTLVLLAKPILFFCVASTVIFNCAYASPHIDAPTQTQEQIEKSEPPTSYTTDAQKLENISVTDVPSQDKQQNLMSGLSAIYNRENYYYPYRKEFSVYAGVVAGIVDSSDDEDLMNFLLGFNYVLPQQLSPRWSVGAELSTVGRGHVHVAKRFTHNEKAAFRPYYEYGVMHKVVPEEKMSSISNLDNYLLWGSIGFSDIRRPPKSIQFQLMAAAGKEDILLMLTGGYAWGF